MNELIRYLISFLLDVPENSDLIQTVGYTADKGAFPTYKIVIFPSGFFESENYGKPVSLPALPLQTINEIPFLYGEPIIEKVGDTIILYADLIASTFFFLTGYEEWVRADGHDKHGRFLGTESLAFRRGFLHRPVVDEYGRLLRRLLKEQGVEIAEPKQQLSKIYLTHDVDHPFQYRTLRGFLGAFYRSIKDKKNEIPAAFRSYFGKIENDPLFTFTFIFDENKKLKEQTSVPVETILFFKSPVKKALHDTPVYNLKSKDIQCLFHFCKKENAVIGLHASYRSGDESSLILQEKEKLEQVTGVKIKYNRHHFLRIKNPMDMQSLVEAGITDDFTLGYADVAGFRLGTSRAVRWINPQTLAVSSLQLHPLTAMEVSLTGERYMNLSENEAFDYLCILIENAREFGGELNLLWHNNSFAQTKINLKGLYIRVIDYLRNS